jgi:NhaP-type Na+/H+ or K+/H+ antiporter
MKFELWYLLMGALLVAVALISSMVKRLPLTTTMLYLGVGVLLGPLMAGVAAIDPFKDGGWLERLAELAVLVSLFTTGLKLRVSLRHKDWLVPLRLAVVTMIFTVGMVTMAGVWWLGLPLGAAVLLGAILAPTDPVLASEVQLESPTDRNKLRFNLTAEAGLNDGTTLPFILLGLGLLGLEGGSSGWRWAVFDLIGAAMGGLAVGALCGTFLGQLVLYLRRAHKESFGLDEFLALGLIGLSYGLAGLLHVNGFLAVLAAGLALRHVERRHTGEKPPEIVALAVAGKKKELATHPEKAPAYLAEAVLGFNEQVERILEVVLVLLVGVMLTPKFLNLAHLLFVPALLLIIRPLAVILGVLGGTGPAAHDFVVRHPWYRLALLPSPGHSSRRAGGDRARFAIGDVVGHRRLGRGAWSLGYGTDELVSRA